MFYRGLIACGLAIAAGSVYAGTFHDVGLTNAQLVSVSKNGRIATGILGGKSAWRWTPETGANLITDAAGTNGMSSWAQPIAGSALDDEGNEVAAVFFSNSDIVGPILVGGFAGATGLDGLVSSGYDVSDNGIVVGLAYDENNHAVAFQWTSAAGISRLPVNRPDNYSRANAISADGSTIIGWNDQEDGFRSGVIWKNGKIIDLVDAKGQPVGEALAVNSDGTVVVGASYFTTQNEAWRWTEETGVQPIGFLGMMGTAYGFGVSDDGNVVVGASGFGFNRSAVVWTPETGMVLLSDYLAQNGVEVPAGWTLITAGSVSADGKVIGGWGLGTEPGFASFVADLRATEPTHALVEAQGSVVANDLNSGPFAGIPEGTPVTMRFLIAQEGAESGEPGHATRYPIVLDSFELQAGTATDSLVETAFGPGLVLANDYPLSDGIHLFQTPMATAGQAMEFELFNAGGDLFDSDDLSHINRTFGPDMFEKASWVISAQGGSFGMYMALESVSIHDVSPGNNDEIFVDGFEVLPN